MFPVVCTTERWPIDAAVDLFWPISVAVCVVGYKATWFCETASRLTRCVLFLYICVLLYVRLNKCYSEFFNVGCSIFNGGGVITTMKEGTK